MPSNDDQRVELLRQFFCAFTPREERFDRITRLARKLLEVPMCAISIVDTYEQWFLSEQGFNTSRVRRDTSLCNHAMVQREMLVIKDTLLDERFANLPQVLGAPFVRAYAGVPLEIEPGLFAGALCVVDTTPRQFNADEIQSLQDLAAIVEDEIRMRPVQGLSGNFVRSLMHEARAELIDPLTGCWNAIGLTELLRRIDHAAQNAPLTLTALQITGFADFPALFGSRADTVIASLAQQIRRTYAEQAVFCRPADDLFLIITEPPELPEQHGLDRLHKGAVSAPRLKEQRFEVLLPSFARPIEVVAKTARQKLSGQSADSYAATSAWQGLLVALGVAF